MKSTTFRAETGDAHYVNTVCHDCGLGEFYEDMQDESKKYFKENKKASGLDLFWYLGEYCDKKYGKCHSQQLDIRSLVNLCLRN